MEKDSGNSFNNDSSFLNEPGSNKSFVKKVRSRVTGLLPSSLSKWFSNDDNSKPTVRPREEDDDDSYEIQQPPSKKAKLPSLNNTHVNSVSSSFELNDSTTIHSSPHSKPNNLKNSLLEPIPGPSGVRTRTLFAPSSSTHYGPAENLLNGDKESDSGESTSGYSSMPKFNKQNVVSAANNKKSEDASFSANPSMLNSTLFRSSTRSLFSERSLSPQVNSSLNSRRPSFNASTFGSPNFIDRTLSTKRIINSPFYSGRTTYGGAAAYSKSLRSSRESSVNQVQVKPVNQSLANDKASLSKTARRILDTLEQYGTPVSEAKKIPNPSRKPQHDGLLSQYTGANPYLMREHKVPNKELQVPTVPDLLKMKLKERLQDSTVAVRQIATTSKSLLNVDEYKIKTVEENVPKHTNKIKKKITAIRQKPENETVEAVKLPNVPLPITNLPKFDFVLPSPVTVKPIKSTESKTAELKVLENISKEPENVAKASEITETPKIQSSPSIKNTENAEFRFSNPLVLAENLVSIIAINDFKFSDPVCKQKLKTDSSTKGPSSPVFNFKPPEAPSTSNATFNFKPGDSTLNLKKKASSSDLPQPATALLSGSVDDIFSKSAKTETSATLDKFKPSPDTWECSVCMIRNLPDKTKCAACEAPKEKPESTKQAPPAIDFGSRFKMSADQWECNVCMVRNASTDTKCVACSTPKTTLEKPKPMSSFGDKFKAPTSTWECPTCMIRNKNELDRCAACETRNPSKKSNNSEDANKKPVSGFGDMFKKKTTEWECIICMVRNPQEKDACVACQTPKAGAAKSEASKSTPIPSFTFGIIPTNKSLSGSNQTKKTESKNTNAASIFGNNKPDAPAPSFTFGIPAKSGTQSKEDKNKENKTEEKLPAPPPTFAFGASSTKSVEKQEDEPKQPPNTSSLFSFGKKPSAKQDDKSEDAKKPENESQKPTPSTSAFTFGKPTLKRSATDTESTATEAKKEAPSSASIAFNTPKAQPPAQKDSTPSTQSNKIAGLFGTATASTTQSTSNSSFTFTQTSTATTTQSNLFGFTAKTTASIFGGNMTTTTTTTEAGPVFKFNSPAGEQSKNQPSFNAPSSNIFGGSNTNFSTPSKITFDVPKSSFETPSKPMFQQNTFNKPVFQNPKPIFDTPGSAPAPARTPAPTTAAAPAPSAPFGAGNSSSIFGTPEVKPFSFNAQPSDNAAKPAGFSFGGPKSEPAKPTFNFGSTAAADPAPPSGGFSFPVNNHTTPNTFGFGTPKAENPSPFQSPAPAANIFGSPQVPVQPVQNGGFNFGASSTNNVKPGFNFGGAAPAAQFNMQPPAPSPAGVFSFGSSNINQAPQQSAAFNFGASAAAPPTFDVNVKPTFNFTGGATPTFSAQPNVESGAASQRKKIRAVRRTQPR